MTSEGGTPVGRYAWDPFGERRDPSDLAQPLTGSATRGRLDFTGHELDDELGLVNMRGRMFDPRLGRFLSPDPVVSNPASSQAYNPYSYVSNNPTRYTDPSGFAQEPTGSVCVGADCTSTQSSGGSGAGGSGWSEVPYSVVTVDGRLSPSEDAMDYLGPSRLRLASDNSKTTFVANAGDIGSGATPQASSQVSPLEASAPNGATSCAPPGFLASTWDAFKKWDASSEPVSLLQFRPGPHDWLPQYPAYDSGSTVINAAGATIGNLTNAVFGLANYVPNILALPEDLLRAAGASDNTIGGLQFGMIAAGPGAITAAGEGLENLAGMARAGVASEEVTTITSGSQVTEEVVRQAMQGAPLKSQQAGGVSLPRIQQYVDKLLSNEVPQAIKVDGSMIVDGNHRYIAGRVLGIDPPIQPWAGGRPGCAVPWDTLPIDSKVWP